MSCDIDSVSTVRRLVGLPMNYSEPTRFNPSKPTSPNKPVIMERQCTGWYVTHSEYCELLKAYNTRGRLLDRIQLMATDA